MKKSINTEKSFSINNINEVYVCTSSPDINLIPIDGEEIKAHFHGDISTISEKNIPQLFCQTNGDKINIEVKSSGFGSWTGNIMLDVYIPNTYSQNVSAKASSGDIKIENFNVTSLKCRTSSGDIDLKSINVENTTLHTSSGDITCVNFEGNLDASTSSGDAFIDCATLSNSNMDVKSSSGDIEFKLPEDSQFNFKAKTSSGDITTEFPIAVLGTMSRKNFEGKIGDSNNTIKTRTSSGDIEIKKH